MSSMDRNEKFLLKAFHCFLMNSPDLMFVKDENLIYLAASQAFADLAGLESSDCIIGKTDYDIFSKDLAERYREDDKKVLQSGISLINYIEPIPNPNGNFSYSSTSKYIFRDEEGNVLGIYGVGRDITAQIELEKEREYGKRLRVKAETDALTGLLHRESVMEQMRECLKKDGLEQSHALLFIDLDYFKEINDNFGHLFGDQILQEVAKRLKRIFSKRGIVGRIGGDEFLALLKNVPSVEDIEDICDEIILDMPSYCFDDGSEIVATCSIGVVVYKGDDRSIEELYEIADRAMYKAKERGRNKVYFG